MRGLLLWLLFFPSFVFAQPVEIDRSELVRAAFSRVGFYMAATFRGEFWETLSPAEKSAYEQIRELGQKWRDAQEKERSLFSVEFSYDSKLFQLAPGQPIRTAVTRPGISEPVIVNMNLINSSNLPFTYLNALQLAIHELGHKMKQKPDEYVAVVDSLAAKLRSEWQGLVREIEIPVGNVSYKLEILSVVSPWAGHFNGLESVLFLHGPTSVRNLTNGLWQSLWTHRRFQKVSNLYSNLPRREIQTSFLVDRVGLRKTPHTLTAVAQVEMQVQVLEHLNQGTRLSAPGVRANFGETQSSQTLEVLLEIPQSPLQDPRLLARHAVERGSGFSFENVTVERLSSSRIRIQGDLRRSQSDLPWPRTAALKLSLQNSWFQISGALMSSGPSADLSQTYEFFLDVPEKSSVPSLQFQSLILDQTASIPFKEILNVELSAGSIVGEPGIIGAIRLKRPKSQWADLNSSPRIYPNGVTMRLGWNQGAPIRRIEIVYAAEYDYYSEQDYPQLADPFQANEVGPRFGAEPVGQLQDTKIVTIEGKEIRLVKGGWVQFQLPDFPPELKGRVDTYQSTLPSFFSPVSWNVQSPSAFPSGLRFIKKITVLQEDFRVVEWAPEGGGKFRVDSKAHLSQAQVDAEHRRQDVEAWRAYRSAFADFDDLDTEVPSKVCKKVLGP